MNKLLAPEKVKGIQSKANSVLNRYEEMPTHELLFKIAKDNNIEILEADLYDISGALRKEGDNWKMYINRQDSPQRKRFTIAHELGHFFLHTEESEEFVDGYVFTRSDAIRYGERELEANEFAGNLVMPESKVRELVKGPISLPELMELSNKFEVSPFAMRTRLKNLELIDDIAESPAT